jgi:hypothetical protein
MESPVAFSAQPFPSFERLSGGCYVETLRHDALARRIYRDGWAGKGRLRSFGAGPGSVIFGEQLRLPAA